MFNLYQSVLKERIWLCSKASKLICEACWRQYLGLGLGGWFWYSMTSEVYKHFFCQFIEEFNETNWKEVSHAVGVCPKAYCQHNKCGKF